MPYAPHDRGGDTYRPQYNRGDGPPNPPLSMYRFRGAAGKRDRNDADERSNFNFRSKPKTSDRPLLRTRHGSKEEHAVGIESDGKKFRNLDELTDSEEAEMEDSDNGVEDRPIFKKARLSGDGQGDEKPRWSNPDPYTALPAPNETTGKKVDFVKLIRKARNSGTSATNLLANDEDFISFEDMDASDTAVPTTGPPAGAMAQNTDVVIGKRKRDDKVGGRLMGPRGRHFYSDGMVLDEWTAREGIHPTPWIRLHKKSTAGLALHKEILDFYEWIKPQDYESKVRADVVDRLSKALNRIEPGELKAFGSFAAGLYLPTGDMDLVYLPRGFNRRRGRLEGISHNQFRKYGDFIRNQRLAQQGSVQLIPSAKVPIIKFVERISGLKVDLSFNNDTGVVANETFQKWREQYPAMPILTSIIKQFLMIRGLNDVSVGGLGGFSTICLVTSILQHIPFSGTPSNLGQTLVEFFNVYGNLFDRENVAVRLDPPGYIDRHSYMSHSFNKDKKGRLVIVDPNRSDNNISGGSSEIERVFRCFAQAHEVLQNRMIEYGDFDPLSGHAFSFLEDIIGGNFEAYRLQRDILYNLHSGQAGPAPAVVPPPPPPISHDPLPPPPPPPPSDQPLAAKKQKSAHAARGNNSSRTSTDEASASKTSSKKTSKAERRATRLRTLRPELAPLIGATISLDDAVKFGRYQDYNEMDKDLTRRELEMSSS